MTILPAPADLPLDSNVNDNRLVHELKGIDMQPFPHLYAVSAKSRADSNVELSSPDLTALESAAPAHFGGPGNLWSPETLLVAAVADCFVLSFKAIAAASKMNWLALECAVEGVLDRVDGVTRFTNIRISATLDAPASVSEHLATRLLEKSEQVCLITNSLNAKLHLETRVRMAT